MEFQRWSPGMPTKHAPIDETFLRTAVNAGFVAYTHFGGLFGAQSDHRSVQIIHRGRGQKWEIIFLEQGSDVVATTTTDLENMTTTVLSWLSGKALTAKEDSVQATVG
ncbi:MAG: hypothetical protein AAF539_10595 [Planctomycetota bacterium]